MLEIESCGSRTKRKTECSQEFDFYAHTTDDILRGWKLADINKYYRFTEIFTRL
jgi:hypothetical protein